MEIDQAKPFSGSAEEEADLLRSPRASEAPEQVEPKPAQSGTNVRSRSKSARRRAVRRAKTIPVSEAGVSDPDPPRGKKEMTKRNEEKGGNASKPQGEGAPGGGSSKRPLPSPETGVPKPKKKQGKGKPTFVQAVKSDWTVHIRSSNGDLDGACLVNLRKAICDKIDAIPPEQVRPTFEASFPAGGAFKMVCSNELSRAWIVKTVKEIDNIGGVELTTGKPCFPRIVLTLPDSIGFAKEKIFELLAKQNPGLKTEKWKFLQELPNAKPNWRSIFVGVDQETIRFVGGAKGRLYYMMQSIKVDVRKPKGSTEAQSRRK